MNGHQLEQAAELVTEFASHTTVPALDRLLAAAEGASAQSSAAELGRTALEITHQTEMLYGEVARFLTLAPDG